MAETLVKKLKPLELLDTLLKSFISLPEKTPLKYSLKQSCWLDQDKIPLELEQVDKLRNKLLMFLQ